MQEEDGRPRRFGFRMRVDATVTVEAPNGREARDALGGLLDGATARVTTGRGVGLELVDMRTSPDVALVLVDGADPVDALRIALSNWQAQRGDD